MIVLLPIETSALRKKSIGALRPSAGLECSDVIVGGETRDSRWLQSVRFGSLRCKCPYGWVVRGNASVCQQYVNARYFPDTLQPNVCECGEDDSEVNAKTWWGAEPVRIPVPCRCPSERYETTPKCSAVQCSSRSLAKHACESQAGMPVVPEIHLVPKICSRTRERFCCKRINASEFESYRAGTADNLESFRDWLLIVRGRLHNGVTHMERRLAATAKSGRVSEENMKILNSIFSPGISELTLEYTRNIVRCAMTGTEELHDGCANYVAYSSYALAYGNKLLSLFQLFHKVIDVAAYGAELTGPIGFIRVGVLETLKGRVVTKTLFPLLLKAADVLQKQRMLLIVGGVVASQAVPLADILYKTISLTRAGHGIGVMLTTLIRTTFWRILCPSIFNPLLMGAVVQWIVQNVILSDKFDTILDLMVSSQFPGLKNAVTWLQSKVRRDPTGVQSGNLDDNLRDAIKRWGDEHEGLAYAVYTLMWTMVSHIFNVVGRISCAAATSVSDVATLVENEAEALTTVASGGLQRAITGISGFLKTMTPGQPGVEQQNLARETLSTMIELQKSLPGGQAALFAVMRGLSWIHKQKVNAVHMSVPVLQGMLRTLGSTSGVISCIVMFVGHHIDHYFENRSKINNVAELHNLINAEKASELETEASIHHWNKTKHQRSEADRTGDELTVDVPWDREVLFDLKALRPVERALQYAKAELQKVSLNQVPRAPHRPPSPLKLPRFVKLYAEARDVGMLSDARPNCFRRKIQYRPLDMPGTKRIYTASVDECQARCKRNMPRCAHFSWWASDGGCHISDGTAKKRRASADAVSGPPECRKPNPAMHGKRRLKRRRRLHQHPT